MSQGLNFPSWQVPELPERIIRMSFCKHVFDLGKRTRRFVAECSYCHGHRLKRHGREHGHRRWVCRGCGKTFPDRTGTVLSSSKLRPSQIRTLLSMLSDGTTLRQAAQKAHVSLQTALLWKRKIQRIPENAGNKVLSGDVWVDHTYINVPMSEHRGRKMGGFPGSFCRRPSTRRMRRPMGCSALSTGCAPR